MMIDPNKLDYIDKLIAEFDKTLGKITSTIDDIIDYVKPRVDETLGKIPVDELEAAIKIAWNYEEESVREYTLAKAIRWVKENVDKEKHSAACLHKVKGDMGYTLHLCFLDKDNNPLLGSSGRHKVVNCFFMDENLEKQLGNKDTVLFK